MSVKTFVITIPKPLPEGAQIKGVVTPQMFTGYNTSGKTNSTPTITSSVSSGNLKFIKQEEPPKLIEIGVKEAQEKTVRKRQKLDHLSYEEKIMRRKLKNRVAAQTARDRKKMRMDELELHVSHLNSKVTEMSDMMEKLAEQNKQLEETNKILSDRLSQCTCNTIGNKFRRKIVARRQLQQTGSEVVAADLKAPVCGMTVEENESAEGCHTAGSSPSLISDATLLSIADADVSKRKVINVAGFRRNGISNTRKPTAICSRGPTKPIKLSIRRNPQQVDVTPSATMDNGCITLTEHNYSDDFVRVPQMDEPSTFNDISVNPATTIVSDIAMGNMEENHPGFQFGNISVPETPEIIEALLDFDSNLDGIKFDPAVVKEELWDLLQDESNLDCSGGYESGYDSSASPRSQITTTSSPSSPLSSFSDDFEFENKMDLNDIFPNFDFEHLLE